MRPLWLFTVSSEMRGPLAISTLGWPSGAVLSIEQVGMTVGAGLLVDTLIVPTFLVPSLVLVAPPAQPSARSARRRNLS